MVWSILNLSRWVFVQSGFSFHLFIFLVAVFLSESFGVVGDLACSLFSPSVTSSTIFLHCVFLSTVIMKLFPLSSFHALFLFSFFPPMLSSTTCGGFIGSSLRRGNLAFFMFVRPCSSLGFPGMSRFHLT